jgi:hypothetical protein
MKKITYDTSTFNFESILCDWFQCESLTSLHKLIGSNGIPSYKKFVRETDQSSIWHKIFYKNFKAKGNEFEELYMAFISLLKETVFNDQCIFYQVIPTFRVQLVGNVSVGEWHKDKSYREEDWAHKIKEKNVYLPFINTNPLNTIWSESVENKGDFAPMLVNYGEAMVWDGLNLLHGNKDNTSQEDRVSVDFRVGLCDNFVPLPRQTVNKQTTFELGGYYNKL